MDTRTKLEMAVQDALYEPTPEMLEAGPVGCCIVTDTNARKIFQAMLDEAIEPLMQKKDT